MRGLSTLLRLAKTTTVLSRAGTVLLILLLILPILAKSPKPWQSPPRPNNQGDNQETIKINVDLVVLHASVQDRERLPVAGLGKEVFQIYEDGVLQQIESFSHGDIPVTVGL